MFSVKSIYLKKDTDLEDKMISQSIIAYFYFQIINMTIKTIVPIPTSYHAIISMFFGGLIVFMFIKSLRFVLKRALIPFVTSLYIFAMIYLVSIIYGNANISLMFENAIWTFCINIPLGIYIYSIKNKEVFYRLFLRKSIGMSILLFLILFFSVSDDLYNMSFAYALLLPTLFHINEWFKTNRKFYLILSLIEIGAILLYGSRGPILSLILILFLGFILNEDSLFKKISMLLIASVIILYMYLNLQSIGEFILEFLNNKGYYSRTLTLFFENRIDYSSGRDELFTYYLNLVSQKPLLGWGVLGGWLPYGLSPHNMIIEIFLAFGLIIGGLISYLLVLSIFRIFYVDDKHERSLLIIFLARNIGLFFISGNILINPNFFIYLYLIFGTFSKRRL